MSISMPERVSKMSKKPHHHTFRKETTQSLCGKVYIVGAGPGDVELITTKGLRTLRKANVVVYDRLVNLDLLDEAPVSAIRVFVGKETGRYAVQQEEINALLVGYAQQGYTVVRLKGGDPYLFGRGDEEALALAQANIAFEVISGVSSALAVPAAAGIPVTHQGMASTVTIVTGQEDSSSEYATVNWKAIAMSVTSGGTLVVLMSVKELPRITRHLLQHALPINTPAAVIQQGTTEYQRVVVDTLDKIANHAKAVKIKSPALLVIGEVVALSDSLAWLENAYGKSSQLIAL